MINMKKLCVGIMAFGVAFGVGNVATQAESDTKNCGDFGGDANAIMEFWYDNGYSAKNDPHNLDGDADGYPCEIDTDTWNAFVAKKEAAKKEDTAKEEATKPEESTSTTPVTTEEKEETTQTTTPKQTQPTETKEQGEVLPNTATNDVAMMGLAGLMAAAGGVLMMKRRKK